MLTADAEFDWLIVGREHFAVVVSILGLQVPLVILVEHLDHFLVAAVLNLEVLLLDFGDYFL